MNGAKGLMPPFPQWNTWTTANRPSTSAYTVNYGREWFGFNQTLSAFEYWNGSAWTVLGQRWFAAAYSSTTAGDIEYDGKAFANNPVASNRGISPSVHFCRSSSDQSGANDTSSQVWFKSGVNALTVAANTTYFFEGVLYITRAAGTTAHTTSVGLNAGATFTSCNWLAEATSSTGNILAPISSIRADSNAFVVVTPSSSAATENVTIRISGIMAIANAGTIQPVFQYSVAPGGVPTIKTNSYFRCYPVGADTVVSVGNWS